jgi:hypothetical protein
MIMLIKTVTLVTLVVNVCIAYEKDENWHSDENESLISLFTRKTTLFDYKVPDLDHPEYISELQSKLLQHQPPFQFAGHSVSEKCLRASAEFLKALENFELWALRSKWMSSWFKSEVLIENHSSARCKRENHEWNTQRERQPIRRLRSVPRDDPNQPRLQQPILPRANSTKSLVRLSLFELFEDFIAVI